MAGDQRSADLIHLRQAAGTASRRARAAFGERVVVTGSGSWIEGFRVLGVQSPDGVVRSILERRVPVPGNPPARKAAGERPDGL